MLNRMFLSGRNGLLALGLMLVTMSATAADLTGTWSFDVEIAGMGSGTATVTLNHADDGSLTGTYAGQLGNTGITGKAFEFVVAGDMGRVTYKGEYQDDGTVTGTLDLGGMANGTFVGTRN
jgi:hypothetical protein